ncbi:flagellar motor protein MotB [Phaeovulum sp.]|uniref:flagellar motor protein MotB n=1 Tax=Phaeovulum sp. TaxID=2934796 RepID=UPI00356AB66E
MEARNNATPAIIKRKKIIAGGGHHGGAWKVAYADFVTAMMAFFMLMWLLNATTEKQRKGIADYFSPTIPVNRVSGGGDGAFGGESVFSEEQIAQSGTGATAQRPSSERQALGAAAGGPDTGAAEATALSDLQRELEKALAASGAESMLAPDVARHVVTRLTDDGLIVELFDLEGEPLFSKDGTTPLPVTLAIAGMLARVFGLVSNEVAISGYVRTYPDVLRVNPEWELSSERAQTFRKLLEQEGFAPARVQRVTGFADRKPAVSNPVAVRNNRLEVTLLRPGK